MQVTWSNIALHLYSPPCHNKDQYNHNHQVRWPRLQAEPRLCLDAQGEGEGRGDQQDDPGDHQYCDFILIGC